ncbi:MAG: aminotransferase class I/II-fold pyridoxal phosphate-dependent enzyme [Candidatus Eisenbacteria bacterium]|nr:aminotransferase class I/II-fold pyridoxal phosphate-dependent enzyme [Candidatus Eisenbacteria bacterium]
MASQLPIDLRSDTITRPSPEMRRAMADAEVGDDVFADDPTVNRLQESVADLLDKEAALLVPSGTMGNEVALRTLTEPGDEIIAHRTSHIYLYEGGAPAALCGCSLQLVDGERGIFDGATVRGALRMIDSHCPVTKLVCVENTANRGGGSVWPLEKIAGVRRVADEHGLRTHLDGARLMNACVASGLGPGDYTRYFDTVSICFSKGLGAPIGSALAGSRERIARAHRFRKMFGGGMRQAGIIAAGALYAIEHNIPRLAEDHANANYLAEALAEIDGLVIDPATVETNLVFFEVSRAWGTAEELCGALHEEGIWMLADSGQRVRAVTHLDVSREQVKSAIEIIARVMRLGR